MNKKPDYKSFLDRVSKLVEEARRKAVKQVNTIIVQTSERNLEMMRKLYPLQIKW